MQHHHSVDASGVFSSPVGADLRAMLASGENVLAALQVDLSADLRFAEGWMVVTSQRLLAWEKAFLDKLELAYRVIDVAAGDLGLSARRKFDCEAWIPTQGRYRELTSTSNCTDFQARRLDIRGRFDDGVAPLATLNGTLVAIPRTIGWLSQWEEMLEDDEQKIARPRQIFTGHGERKYVPVERR